MDKFTEEEIDEIKNMLYQVNAGEGAINPPSPTWYSSVEQARQNRLKNG